MTISKNESIIWSKLKSSGLSDEGVAGLMGNLYAESLMNPKNLETVYEKKLGYTDDSYTKAVDDGSYNKFSSDSAGYGLAQWTYGPRKRNLLSYAKSVNKSVGDLDMQIAFLINELKSAEYVSIWNGLKNSKSVYDSTIDVMVRFEKPANVSQFARNTRYSYAKEIYERHHEKSYSPEINSIVETIAKQINDGLWGDDWKTTLVTSVTKKLEEIKMDVIPSNSDGQYHKIVSGDTLTKISKTYNTTISKILADNQVAYPQMTEDFICAGWVIKV